MGIRLLTGPNRSTPYCRISLRYASPNFVSQLPVLSLWNEALDAIAVENNHGQGTSIEEYIENRRRELMERWEPMETL